MPVTVVRFDLVEPDATPASLSARHRAALEMAAYADARGVTTVRTEEHHGAGNIWLPSPSPFAFASAVFGATRSIAVTVSAVIGPLHDPLRLAEEIAVLDLLSGGGRLVTVAGIGYRPEEYAMSDVEWKRRGRLQDELLETLLRAWTGEPFAYRGRTVRVTPRPLTEPHPPLLVGGSSKAAARRAARLGLPFFPGAHLPELEAYRTERLAEYGTEASGCARPRRLRADTTAPPRLGQWPSRGGGGSRGEGQRGLGPSPRVGGGQPMSSSFLPLVSGTNLRMKGMERKANTAYMT
ncbi:LLM class flavin-dependent oxidoreductase [Streptomyces sp. KAU_LT]|uniref:LLM class flavin-dependent oxidoreductase n=1 Tax=Streptomyces sp. KAU_LT TaxID=3046669 RepID=UPI0024B70696|nr:LLM class flavin-dependent oxidoreductase [Streptomyces sp. KAU_LT]MDI9830938.1 LLM class flavin-dependent oxidoreductase [Streptomyces sp. KAU_LT]